MTSRLIGVCILALLWPEVAEAHLVTTGLGPLYDGISHVLISVEDLLPILALALLAGLNGAAAGRRMLFGVCFAWLAGGVGGFWVGENLWPEATVCVSLITLGGLTAADQKLSPTLAMQLAVIIGLLHGWLNGVALVSTQQGLLGLVGIVTTVFVLVAIVTAGVICLRRGWTRIIVRVAGSWGAATGLLLLGWNLKGMT
ncbi:MAG: HupE/UreJ family protein [Desulfuromonadales bacterium]